MKKRMNGEGSIRILKDGRLEYRYYDNKVRKSVYAKTQKELLEKVKVINFQVLNGSILTNSKITIGELYLNLINDKLNTNIIKENTYKRHLETFKRLESTKITNMYISKAEVRDIEKALHQLVNYSQSVIDKCFIALKEAFKEGLKYNIINKNIMEFIKKPNSNKDTKKVTSLTKQEQEKLENVIIQSKYYMQYLIALNTGMRIGEINALQKKDIDINNKLIYVNKTLTRDGDYKTILSNTTKTKKGIRTCFITDKLINELKEYISSLENEDFLFLTNRKTFVSTSAINSEFKRLNSKYNIHVDLSGNLLDVNTHMLRHTFATRCIEAGVPAEVLKEFLGHTDITVTINTYTDIFNEHKEKSYNKLNNYFNKI